MGTSPRAGRGWIAFVVVNLLVAFFGLSYIFFPMGTVVADGNQTTGLLHVPRELWGSYVVLSALAMLTVAAGPYRHGLRRAWYALLYQFVFFVAVAAIEPDPVVPTVLGIVLAVVLARSRGRFFAEKSAPVAA